MKAIRKTLTPLLTRCGIDARQYWLLLDLFGELSDRGEMRDQLGTDRSSLKIATVIYFGFSVLLTWVFVAVGLKLSLYLGVFLLFTAFTMVSVLLAEAGNSLVNPVEGSVLAHQPIDGATYAAAKLTHLVFIVLYLVAGFNAAPALAGLWVKGTRWWYPIAHLAAAMTVGFIVALGCCAAFGWLLRFIPARRLKVSAQIVAALPIFLMFWSSRLGKLIGRIQIARYIPHSPAVPWSICIVFAGLALAAVIGGIRSLSADYLIRVSGMMHGGASRRRAPRRSFTGPLIARLFGGQSPRAGAAFLNCMMLRDWQFRRQLAPMLAPIAIFAIDAGRGWKTDPFGQPFSPMHVLPHAFGFLLLFVCLALPYGSDHKAMWFFLTVPVGSIGGFAKGVWATLWLRVVLIPHLVLLIPLAAVWGFRHGVLFVAYSAIMSSLYLSLELRLVESVPFMRQPDASRGTIVLPILIGGAIVASIMVALQYFIVFHSPAVVLAVTVAGAVAVCFSTRSSLRAVAEAMRFNLGLASSEVGPLYREIL